jgi:retron-type reverse transcriptase
MYAKLSSWENLLLAFRRAAKGKRGRPNVAAFEYRLEENLLELQEELCTRTYCPRPYTSFYIHEPKRRLISAAPFRDRVVHHALCNLIEPVFERTFIADSFANRVGKGTHRALERVQKLARRFPYVLQCDIRQFFPSIDHAILRDILAGKIGDSGILWLIDRILESGIGVLKAEYEMVYFSGDDLFAVNRARGRWKKVSPFLDLLFTPTGAA